MQMLDKHSGQDRSGGATASRVRNHNERALLSLMRAQGAVAGAQASKHLGLSAQTASVILRALEEAELVTKLDPVKGKVGKPQLPYTLNPKGAYSLGLRLGRRGADLLLMTFTGDIAAQKSIAYRFPTPAAIETFVVEAIPKLIASAELSQPERVVGLGLAVPFELWNWLDALGVPRAEADAWRDYDLKASLERASGLPTIVANDMNMACNAELVFGAGRGLRHFTYFHVGSFVGGGVVMNGKVYHGPQGNAGALGSIPVRPTSETQHQLIHSASLYALEHALSERLGKPVNLRAESCLFGTERALCETWRKTAAHYLARAITAVTAVLDISDTIIDGSFPKHVRDALIDDTRAELRRVDTQGLNEIRITPGQLGNSAGALGAAYEPLLQAHFVEGSALR